MINRSNSIILSAAFIISVAVWFIVSGQMHKPKKIDASIFRGAYGWGYDILVNDSLFIHQESVPAVSGNRGFAKREQACLVAEMIINKMKAGHVPTITTLELQQIAALEELQYAGPRNHQ